jgi:hypothetical protein
MVPKSLILMDIGLARLQVSLDQPALQEQLALAAQRVPQEQWALLAVPARRVLAA